LILNIKKADFAAAAMFLSLCCSTPQITDSVHTLQLSYGSFAIELCDKNEAQLIRAAHLCSLIIKDLLPEK
jgi:hypothetical protein